MLTALFYGTIVLLSLCILKAAIAVRSINASMKLVDRPPANAPAAQVPHVVIVLCVLREQRILEETVEYFRRLSYPPEKLHLLVVTTERELAEAGPSDGAETTIDLIKKIQRQHPAVRWLHYPEKDGLKSDQMNYAVEQFGAQFLGLDASQTFYAFYDADSRPAVDVLDVFLSVYATEQERNVFQQSAVYLKNYFEFNRQGWFRRHLLKALSLKQTRFIFAYEIPRILRVYGYCAGKSRSAWNRCTYAPCVAHGLFVRVALLEEVPFPDRYTPEDMYWGFVCACLKEPIAFLPSLDQCDTPDSIKKVFLQLARWFKGPFQACRYKRFVKEHHADVYQQHRLRIHLLAAFAVWDAANWLATSAVLYFCIAMGVVFGWKVWALLGVFVAIYQFGCWKILNRFPRSSGISFWEKLTVMLCGPVALLFHSLPAYYSLWAWVRGKEVNHKTERQ